MKSHRVVLGVFVLCLIPLFASVRNTTMAATTAQAQDQPVVKEIELKAKKYEYTPNNIEIPLHTVVRFKITAEDHDHGFEIESVKNSCITIPKGESKVVEYKADTAGTFKFKCCHFCGTGHGGMKGTFTVK